MITFKNNIPNPIKLIIGDEIAILKEYEEYQFDNKSDYVEFIVKNESTKKKSVFRYLLLTVISFIKLLLDMTDREYLDFRKALSLPVSSKLYNIKSDVLVMIEEPRKTTIDFCIVNSNTETEINTVIDEEEIHKQYKNFQKECFAVLSIPLLITAVFLYFIIISKNIIAYIVGAIIVAFIYSIWYYHHKKNIKTISNIIKNNSL